MKKNKTVVIIGAGIVGLATGYQLLRDRPDLNLIILEKEKEVATHQTGHNSGVIHSGIYYRPNSHKAINCIKGYRMLIDFCDQYGISYDICGKLIVATDESEIPYLKTIYNRGLANGLTGLKYLNTLKEIKNLEPYVSGINAIVVPQTGIIDFKKVANKLRELIKLAGGNIYFSEEVKNIKERNKGKLEIETTKNVYEANAAINCAGLYSGKIASLSVPKNKLNIAIVPFRGEYYKIKEERKHLVKNLIYPVPNPNFPFLGVHFTRMLNGDIEAGPNAVFAFKREGYNKSDFSFSEFIEFLQCKGFRKMAQKYWKVGLGEYYRSYSKKAFTRALQKLIPAITEKDLIEVPSGVRAQAFDNQTMIDDFVFFNTDSVINVCNAPSPAATSSLSIGRSIAHQLKDVLP